MYYSQIINNSETNKSHFTYKIKAVYLQMKGWFE